MLDVFHWAICLWCITAVDDIGSFCTHCEEQTNQHL